mgnify:CR=1 FL=1
MKEIGYTMLSIGIALAVVTADVIIGVYFGVQYCFLLMSVEFTICGLLLIKFDDKTEDKL